jgi:hypothetical protein
MIFSHAVRLIPSCDHIGNLSLVGADLCVSPQAGGTRRCPPTDRKLFLLLLTQLGITLKPPNQGNGPGGAQRE